MNFKNFGNDDAGGGGNGSWPPGNFGLTRQPSIYSLTFDEFQSTMGGVGKDFGSMNMDELLKNIWSAEEMQMMVAASNSGAPQDGLQRQGSLTLPRTLSQKTVDEVWKDISKDYGGGSGTMVANVHASQTQRQQTLGEMTLEEFLARAGVMREDTEISGKANTNGGLFGDLSCSVNNSGLAIGFQQNRGVGLSNNTNQISIQSSNLPLSISGVRSNPAQPQQQQQQQQIYPKQPNAGYVTPTSLQSSPGIRSGIMGIVDQGIGNSLMQGGGMGIVGLGGVATGSPVNQLSSDGIAKSNGDTSSVSPVPYVFNGGLRGRRTGGAVEKVAERRQRRMIKNRESAARSRARKQAYTTELEAEVQKLKEENQELRNKQAEVMEMQKHRAMEMMNMQQGGKKLCLRRTQTGPW